jgi:hypothetical protein
VRRLNRYIYPRFQFSAGRVKSVVKSLLELAQSANRSTEDLVLWLCSLTVYLADAGRPVDYLDDADLVLSVAGRAWGVEW